ncbi:MAG: IS1096 element passenger TnpR family protein [Isosphaeraceae bacterium]
MDQFKATGSLEKILRGQVIDSERPGTVLGDFQRILDFLGNHKGESSGKYNLLPIKWINELDGLLSRPLHLRMKRPQIRSHPHLQGLNLLLRASGLMVVQATGAKSWLVIDQEMKLQWDNLNPTERYFNLLESWLLIGRAEMVGAGGSRWDTLLSRCLQCWHSLSREAYGCNLDDPEVVYIPGLGRDFYLPALMDLFGLVKLDRPSKPVIPWCPAKVSLLPFGDAVFALLAAGGDDLTRRFYGELAKKRGVEIEDEDQGEDEDEDEEDANDDGAEAEEEATWEEPSFGTWQPLFQPFFPEWRQNLIVPEPEPLQGTLVFRVSLGNVWRLIAMPASQTLHDLISWVLRSVKFDDDHLYSFIYRDRLGRRISANHPYMNEDPWADQVSLKGLPLAVGQTMDLVYDFGDNWQFAIKLVRVEPPDAKIEAPSILEKHGKSPEQYPSWDE